MGSHSFDRESVGITRNTGRFPDSTITEIRTGIERGYSAAFRGNLGTIRIEVQGMFGTANIFFSQGTNIEITRTSRRP
jgi:hypothetical protein